MNILNILENRIVYIDKTGFITKGSSLLDRYSHLGVKLNTIELPKKVNSYQFLKSFFAFQNAENMEINFFSIEDFEFVKSINNNGWLLGTDCYPNSFIIENGNHEFIKIDGKSLESNVFYSDFYRDNYLKIENKNSLVFDFMRVSFTIKDKGIELFKNIISAHSFSENKTLWSIGLEDMKFEKSVDWYDQTNDGYGAYFYEDEKFIVLYQTHQICIELHSGKILWETSLLIDPHHGLLENNILYLFRHGILYKLDANSGTLLKTNENIKIREENEMALKGINRYSMPMSINDKMYLIQGGGLHIAVYDKETLELEELNPILRSFKNHRLGPGLFSTGNKLLLTLDHVNNKMSTVEYKTIILEV